MIVYNIRANGPYEYDKFMLNYGQLYNLAKNAETDWKNNTIHTLNRELSNMIQAIYSGLDQSIENNILEHAAIIKRIITE